MYGLLHELMELVLLISAIAVTWAVPRPQWVTNLYNKIGRFFGKKTDLYKS
jgi:cytochrome c oxidase assembly factor CtaG